MGFNRQLQALCMIAQRCDKLRVVLVLLVLPALRLACYRFVLQVLQPSMPGCTLATAQRRMQADCSCEG